MRLTLWRWVLPAKTARVLAHLDDGTPCITSSTYGKGQTLFIGSFLSFVGRSNNQFFLSLLDWAKVSRPFKTSQDGVNPDTDRKSTRLNSSHLGISDAVFC